jgi:alpha-L-fucosidase
MNMTTEQRLQWFRDARFGMMITWGIYALEAAGEWVQYKRRIPVKEYEKLAARFNPVRFDAAEWVRCAKEAGMKYMVAMAKHHDGFAMFPSHVSSYNLMDATPWKCDFLKELADTCRAEGLYFGLYYSHVREWHHPHASSLEPHNLTTYGNYGNFWDYPCEELKDLQTFLDKNSLPQLREVLERYQPDLIWFDTPSLIRPDQAKAFHNLVREVCPQCLINSRIGKTAEWDYLSCGDNEIPELDGVDFETPMVMNGAWGYNTHPEKVYKPAAKFINDLIATASRGGNYLLNVGPDPLGCFQEEAKDRLKRIGEWLRINGEAIYGTTSVPLPEPDWGKLTAKRSDNTIYLFVQKWQSEIVLRGLESAVSRCVLLATGDEVPFTLCDFSDLTQDLILRLPESCPDQAAAVIRIELAESLRVYVGITENRLQIIELRASRATIHRPADSSVRLGMSSVIEQWREDNVSVSWDFTVAFAGSYQAEIELKTDFFGEWDSGYTLHAGCDGSHVAARFQLPDNYISMLCSYESKVLQLGDFTLAKGRHSLTLSAAEVVKNLKTWRGVSLAAVRLIQNKN